ncbi:MAG: rhodanese-like domain-containing protein [Acidithiobacillus ferriphilus]|jgi:thiosulfate sulfurtransferase (EC 2.8.1.1)|uniref:Sulfurtransferase n=2 Tax=Acidithiobacillus TaxID=119977 RepID=A0A179BKC7_ACIFR|nr:MULTISPECIES: rhodanese-like domain-containing protein [Acidithiobacillus]MBU2786292.1 rhodanese-like domain-containing protein [Acidithiobacillus ferriphilus]MBU2828602.1 rhodanese-like domain-containing protein [Acidithiobacillus ferriphilus]MBU2830627.1 rhodanese-like domain-containing protein [Acidithiobacillus ferriphilus]MBU2832350.1 rhodanese-like domain-containing protein [Acidithiobacillus ferriphilus]MBU2846940.1 rhodanese-like domain-containing protein [Acidithiobacillus ferriphi
MTKSVIHLAARDAFNFLQEHSQAVLVDVRSEMEFLFVGHPKEALSIPWRDAPDWEINPDFLARVRRATSLNRPTLLICRSGQRSLEAGLFLRASGFGAVYNVTHGFEGDLNDQHCRSSLNGWRFDGLPWEQC